MDMDTNVLSTELVPHTVSVKHFSNAGNAHIEKYMHPPSAVEGYQGPPDFSTQSTVLQEYRTLDICQATGVGYIGGTSSEGFVSNNYLLLTTTGGRVTTIGFSIGGSAVSGSNTTTQVVQDLANTFINTQYDYEHRWNTDVSASRWANGSVTTDLNATQFGDKGLVAVAKFRPTILWRGPVVAFVRTLDSKTVKAFVSAFAPGKQRKQMGIRELTSLEKAQHPPDHHGFTFEQDVQMQIFQLNGFNSLGPTSPGQTLGISRKSYGAKARCGTFSVQHYLTQEPKWMDVSDTQASSSSLVQCVACHRNTDGSLYFVSLLEPSPAGTPASSAPVLTDTMWNEAEWVWTLYSGVNRTATITSGANEDAALATPIIKRYYTLQLVPSLASAFNAFSKPPPDPDTAALAEAAILAHHMPDALESKYNFLGALVNAAKMVAASPAVKPFVSRVKGIVGNAAKQLVAQGGQTFLSGLLQTTPKVKAKTNLARAEDAAIAATQGVTRAVADAERRAANVMQPLPQRPPRMRAPAAAPAQGLSRTARRRRNRRAGQLPATLTPRQLANLMATLRLM